MNNKDTAQKVLAALNSIRPFLIKDGGDIELISVEGSQVIVKLQGNCNSCPMNITTMKLGVENTIKQYAPEISEVLNIE